LFKNGKIKILKIKKLNMKKLKLYKVGLIIVAILISINQVQAEILWQENFDSQADWQLTQPQAPAQSLSAWQGESTIPPNFDMYYIRAYEIDENQHNSIIISSTNARGGTGKAATFWNESCSESSSWQSDNQIGTNLPESQGYNEIWVQSWIKFDPTWQFSTTNSSQDKMGRVGHYDGTGSPFQFGGSNGNVQPMMIWGLSKWGGGTYPDSTYHAWRYENTYYPTQATPSHSSSEVANLGINDLYDNQWHKLVYHVKLNSAIGVADGEYSFSVDDNVLLNETDLAYGDQGAQISPRKGWNEVSWGGNDFNKYAPCSANQEQYYIYDDLCITTTQADLANCFSAAPVTPRADVNQQNGINTTDAYLTLRNSLGLNMNMTNWQPSTTTGDVNCDNSSNSTDAYLILRYSLGLGMNGTGWCVN
jgi:hypothetical protein